MIRETIVGTILVAGLLIVGISQASSAVIETQHLIVSDATGKSSNDQLKSSADKAQAMLGRILAFWSADPGVDRLEKIRVVFHGVLGATGHRPGSSFARGRDSPGKLR